MLDTRPLISQKLNTFYLKKKFRIDIWLTGRDVHAFFDASLETTKSTQMSGIAVRYMALFPANACISPLVCNSPTKKS
jgi:hypothetical protein